MSEAPHEPWQPLLVVEGHTRAFWGRLTALAFVATFALVFATAILAYVGALPWLPTGAPVYLLVFHVAFWKLVIGPVAVTLAVVVARQVAARTAHVEFFVDRIAISRHEGAVEVPWSDVVGFHDGSVDYVLLLTRPEAKLGKGVAVPTPTEAARTGVLDLLARRGLVRVE